MNTRSLYSFGLAVLVSACQDKVWIEPNPDHCTRNEGDRYCAELFPERPYCVQGQGECALGDQYGCLAEVPAECRMPCGVLDEDECVGASSSSSETGASSESGSSESGSSESSSTTTGPMPCVSDEECTDADAPFCGASGECGGCEGTVDPDAACAGVDMGLPICEGGTCVQCTAEDPAACTGVTPICDGATNSCVPCDAHDQCGEAACNLFSGACLPGDADAIAHVGPGEEIASLNEAVMSFPGSEGTVIVHAGPSYDEFVMVDGGRTVAFLAADGDLPLWVLTAGGAPQLEVTAGSTVLIDGLQVSGNASDLGLRVNDGRAWVDRSRIIQNTGGGVLAENGAELVLRNCFVGQVNDVVGVEVIDASATVLYSTLATSTFGTTPALSCTTPVTVEIRNSIIVSQGGTPPDELACPSATVTFSATEGIVDGVGNQSVGMFPSGMPGDWFMNYAAGDYGLQNDGLTLFADIAQWSTGDPPTDIDGDPRPNLDGSPDYAGADVP